VSSPSAAPPERSDRDGPAVFVVEVIHRRRQRRLHPGLLAGLGLALTIITSVALLAGLDAGGQPAAPLAPGPYQVFITATPLLPTIVSGIELGEDTYQDIPIALPTFAPALFVTATPVFNLWDTIIVYVCYLDGSDEICMMRADGSEQRRLTHSPGTDWYPSFSPDGSRIAYSSQRDGQFNIYSMDLNGEDVQRLTRNHGEDYAPAYSPDGSRIVFTSTYGENGDQNIWVMNADGGDLIQLTTHPGGDIDPMWSPDGTRISFASNRNGLNDLYIMNADGSNVRQVTRGTGLGGRNDWSPDGRYLVFYAGPEHEKDLFLVETACAGLDGGCPPDMLRRLTNGGNNKGPSFSPDGQWVTFTSDIDGDNEIFVVSIDGTARQQLTFNAGADWQPRWRP
jgi:Tol biopolymer transport system component